MYRMCYATLTELIWRFITKLTVTVYSPTEKNPDLSDAVEPIGTLDVVLALTSYPL